MADTPTMAGWNLSLRFGLEVAALVGLGVAGWNLGNGPSRWLLAAGLPLAGAVVWGRFNVPGDPSRSGAAPVVVDGWLRLTIELAILGAGAAAIWWVGQPTLAVGFSALAVVQYATAIDRLRWLVDQ